MLTILIISVLLALALDVVLTVAAICVLIKRKTWPWYTPQIWLRLEDRTELPLGVALSGKSRTLIPEEAWIVGLTVRGLGNCFYDFRLLADPPRPGSDQRKVMVPLEVQQLYGDTIIYDCYHFRAGPMFRKLTLRVMYGPSHAPYKTLEFDIVRPALADPLWEELFLEDDEEWDYDE